MTVTLADVKARLAGQAKNLPPNQINMTMTKEEEKVRKHLAAKGQMKPRVVREIYRA
jgi:hypothetical protein